MAINCYLINVVKLLTLVNIIGDYRNLIFTPDNSIYSRILHISIKSKLKSFLHVVLNILTIQVFPACSTIFTRLNGKGI